MRISDWSSDVCSSDLADIEVGGRAGRKQGKATAAERYDGEIVRQVEMGRDLSRVAEPDARGRAFHQRKGVPGGEAGQVDVESGRAGIDGDRPGPVRDVDEVLGEAGGGGGGGREKNGREGGREGEGPEG